MKRSLLYSIPTEFEERAEEIAGSNEGVTLADAKLLIRVELAFALMERLGMDDEPTTAPWILLSGIPVRDERLLELNLAGRRAIANTRQIIPFSARFAWLDALRDYKRIPLELRNYDFELSEREACLINSAKKQPFELQVVNEQLYETCLTAILSFRYRKARKPAEEGKTYLFKAIVTTRDGPTTQTITPEVQITFTVEDLAAVSALENWMPMPIRISSKCRSKI